MRTIDDDFVSYMALAGALGMSFDHWGGFVVFAFTIFLCIVVDHQKNQTTTQKEVTT